MSRALRRALRDRIIARRRRHYAAVGWSGPRPPDGTLANHGPIGCGCYSCHYEKRADLPTVQEQRAELDLHDPS